MEVVYEELQQILHNLHDISMFGDDRRPFRGVVFEGVQFVWRDAPLTHWTIRIEPMGQVEPLHPQPLTEVLAEMEEDDEAIRPGADN